MIDLYSYFLYSFLISGKKVDEAAENRNYLAHRMTDEINEIIRVLQLTTYDEDEWETDDLNVIKKALVLMLLHIRIFHF